MKNPQLYLQRAWNKRNKLYAEGDKLYAEGCKLYTEGGKLYAEGRLAWINAVIKVYGPKTEIKYTSEGCEVMGVVYKS